MPAWSNGSSKASCSAIRSCKANSRADRWPAVLRVLGLFDQLPPATLVSHLELLHFIDRHRLMGRGLGWVDMHLLASTLASRATIATRDARLARAADALGVAA